MVQSLHFMHSLKIIHGDIKPSNIMWSPKFNKLVFIDFGLTKTIR
jgi:serine/threonine protein kinase